MHLAIPSERRIKAVAKRTFTDPYTQQDYQFTWRTISTWLYRYKKGGITTLEPKRRSDRNTHRKVSVEQVAEALHEVLPTLRKNKQGVLPKSVLYRALLSKGYFTRRQLAPTTFYKMLRAHPLLDETVNKKLRLSFAMQYANQLWQADTMYGPTLKQANGQWKKTFLIAFIDDASRVITHAEFFYRDNTEKLVQAFRTALFKRGKPERLYFDNGANYSAKELWQACIRLDIQLSHAPVRELGEPDTGKTVLREHMESWNAQEDKVVVAISRAAHPYGDLLKQLADAFQIELPYRGPEKVLIQTAYQLKREGKTLYTLIDEAHLLAMHTLRKLRLMFDQFPKQHNLVLFGQADLMYFLSMRVHQDIKTRITYSQTLCPLNDEDIAQFIETELSAVGLGANTLNEGVSELIVRSVEGNLRLCRNLCYGALVEACRHNQRQVGIQQVNEVLIQPHWRSHEEVIKQQMPLNTARSRS